MDLSSMINDIVSKALQAQQSVLSEKFKEIEDRIDSLVKLRQVHVLQAAVDYKFNSHSHINEESYKKQDNLVEPVNLFQSEITIDIITKLEDATCGTINANEDKDTEINLIAEQFQSFRKSREIISLRYHHVLKAKSLLDLNKAGNSSRLTLNKKKILIDRLVQNNLHTFWKIYHPPKKIKYFFLDVGW